MANKKQAKIKAMGDQKLVAEIEKLQNQIALEQDLDQTTLDLSEDNYVQNRILKAKYTFCIMKLVIEAQDLVVLLMLLPSRKRPNIGLFLF